MNRKFLFVSGIELILLVLAVATALYQNQMTGAQGCNLSKNQTVPERAGAPVKGPLDARVTIVQFRVTEHKTRAHLNDTSWQYKVIHPGLDLHLRYRFYA